VLFGKFAEAWVKERPGLRPNTAQVYRYVLRRHLIPTFGNSAVADIRDGLVRRWRWRQDPLEASVSPTSVAKSYRLLKAIMTTAVEDGVIPATYVESRERLTIDPPNYRFSRSARSWCSPTLSIRGTER
jgi:Phage integrase, N-terminal SAM-like domain